MTLEVGSLLNNRYRIKEIIAKGGMGSIYRALDESLSIEVAVKENLIENEYSTRQFRREATILASLRHPNLPRVTDHFDIPLQGQYLVMDYIEGDDLRKRIDHQTSLPEEDVILIGAAICDALTYLHTRSTPIVHRDIKPGNIKITPNGEIFLVDFGIAKISQPGIETTTGAQSLTPGFAPPEQYGQGTDSRSDIYALGATLYMALTGKIPENGLSRLMNETDLTPVTTLKPSASPGVAAAIEKALIVDKFVRYQKAEDFKHDLLAANPKTNQQPDHIGDFRVTPAQTVTSQTGSRENFGQLTRKDSTPRPGPEPGKRRKTMLFGLLGIFGVLIICTGLLAAGYFFDLYKNLPFAIGRNSTAVISETSEPLTQNIESNPTETEESLPTATAEEIVLTETALPPTETAAPTLTATLAQTPVGGGLGEIAFVSDRSGTPQIYLFNLTNEETVQITNELDGACQPDWSPDGSRLVYTSPCRINTIINPITETYKGSSLYIVSADGSNRTTLATTPGGDFDPAWSPDGSKIAFATLRDNLTSTDLNIYVYDLNDNQATKLTGDLNSDRRPAWSPDGSMLAFQRQATSGSNLIYVMDADGGNITTFSDIQLTNAFMPDWGPNNIITFSQGNPFPKPIVRLYSSGNTPFETLSDDSAFDINFSPDGFWLVFERITFDSNGNRSYNIFRMASNGGTAIQLTNDEARDYQPVWRPKSE